ncbi:GNAT family N-acetyltransferase [bacterium]|nr:GNAT family N-acetyltransferase [bacterium]
MHIDTPTPDEHAEYLALVNAEIRPHRAETTARDDFPVILHAANREMTLTARSPEGALMGGIAALVRSFKTSCGSLQVAGIGSVVTAKHFRGLGVSSALQNALMERLRGKNVPLAVLWTDRPEIYSGRGFVAAGWELHCDLRSARLQGGLPDGFTLRSFRSGDASTVASLYDDHPLSTVRLSGDADLLYGMPGTRGLVAAERDGRAAAAVFVGKGADFPGYILEWDGPARLVEPLVDAARNRLGATHILVPAGEDELARLLVGAGAGWWFVPSGCWAVLDGEELRDLVGDAAGAALPGGSDPRPWLGTVGPDGQPLPGLLTLAVWGFDSV